MKKLFLIFIAFTSIYSFNITLIDSLSNQRTDGSQIIDIYYEVTDVPTEGLTPFPKALIFNEYVGIIDTLEIIRVSASSDVGRIYTDGLKHIEWFFGEDYPDYEFRDNKLLFNIAVTTTGRPPDDCFYEKYVDGGGDHILVNKDLNTIYGCGWNRDGQVGDASNTNRSYLVQTRDGTGAGFIDDVLQIGANGGGSYGHSIALRSDGSVWCWGKNHHGELGDGSHTDSNIPVRVVAPSGSGYFDHAIEIACGGYHNLILRDDGTVWAFGLGGYGQLGDGYSTNRSRPVQVVHSDSSPLTDIVHVACGFWYSFAIDTHGQVWAWGWNSYGELGIASTINVSYPTRVLDTDGVHYLSGIKSVEAGCFVSIFEKNDGQILICGYNNYGQLGLGYTGGMVTIPTNMLDETSTPLVGVSDFDSGEFHTVILKPDGTVWACGLGENGQLGNGSTLNSSLLVQVNDEFGTGHLANIIDITCNLRASYAVDEYGNIWSFGNNNRGQLGVGTTTSASIPSRMLNPDGVTYFEAF